MDDIHNEIMARYTVYRKEMLDLVPCKTKTGFQKRNKIITYRPRLEDYVSFGILIGIDAETAGDLWRKKYGRRG